MIVCKELDQSFETKEELFRALKSNKDKIISIKKKNIYTGYDPINPENSKQTVVNNQRTFKSLDVSKTEFKDDDYFYIAVNTIGILDSHGDLHVKGIWNKSAKEQSGKNFLIDTHSLTVKNTFAYPEDIEIFVAEIPFKSIGKNYKGNTEALIYKVSKDNFINQDVKKALEEGKSIEASVKMQYVTIDLAMNSDDPEDKEELKTYNDYKNQISNIEDFKEAPLYYMVVKEAKNIHESSLVPFASNGATGKVNIKEPPKGTPKKEAVTDTSHNYLLM